MVCMVPVNEGGLGMMVPSYRDPHHALSASPKEISGSSETVHIG